jgi:HlyD family secretion protein
VGTQVSGQIKELYADFNSPVTAGQLIAQIDPETFEYKLRSVQADLDSAQAQALGAQANVNVSTSQVAKAKLDLEEAKRDGARKVSLVEKGFITASEADKAKATIAISNESFKIAQAQLSLVQAQAKAAQALVVQRQSSVAQAKIDLERTKIRSPINGIVIKRTIEKGQTVAASLQSPELFVIAQNLSDMQVEASIDESDIGKVKVGQKASFTVDAFAGQTFDGLVKQVRKAAQNVSNVVTYTAIVSFSNASGQLLPGMTANIRVITESKDNVLKVPNAALRVKIAGIEPSAIPSSNPSSNSSIKNSTGSLWMSSAYAQNPPATNGRGGGLMAMKEKLTQELELNVSQQNQLDELMLQARPKFMALRDLSPEQGLVEREKILAEIQKSIKEFLTKEQKIKYNAWLAQQENNRKNQVVSPAANNAANGSANTLAKGSANGSINPKASTESPSASRAASAGVTTKSAPTSSVATSSGAINAGNNGVTGNSANAGAGSAGAGGPMNGFASRLTTDLALTASQQTAVEGIMAQVRPQMMALRDLPEADRAKARERVMADMRSQIADLLSPEQKIKYQVILAETASKQATRGKIYIMNTDGSIKAINVRLGITNGSFTELIINPNSPEAADLKEGAQVITGILQKNANNASGKGDAGATNKSPSGPRMPF